MNIQKISIDKLHPARYNPRADLKPGDPEYDMLAKGIGEFGLVVPLVWNKRSGNLVGGHQRLKVLKQAGIKEVQVSVVDLPDDKEQALNIALNKISGEWDMPALKDLLEELDTGDIDMDLTGWNADELEELMTQVHQGETEDDAVPEVKKSICKTGDLWELGEHRLLCGDATKVADVARLMGGDRADMVFTDPPYGVDYTGKTKKALKIQNDTHADMYSWLCKVFKVAFISMKKGCPYYVCCPAGSIHRAFLNALTDSGLPVHQGLVWLKDSMVLGHSDYHYKHEPILYGWKKDGPHYFTSDRTQVSVFDIPRPKRSEDHPTMKPPELMVMAISNSSRKNNIVLDPFLGSGSTLIACEKTGRRCRGMEIDEHYCDVVIARWQDYTGGRGKKIKKGAKK